ncbi:hypothetical protein K439DRAFT_1613041 [Ramaria rubella]|nr:hypothetical protein K439DRAFT_1613041 [Ramaria rubella]
MKFNMLATLAFAAVSASAQSVSIVAPAPNTQLIAGQSFTATVAFQDVGLIFCTDTTSSVDVVALIFGLKLDANDPDSTDLGQTRLTTIVAPTFRSTGPEGQMVQNVNLTLPTDPINGINITYSLTCGEFYTLGVRVYVIYNTICTTDSEEIRNRL